MAEIEAILVISTIDNLGINLTTKNTTAELIILTSTINDFILSLKVINNSFDSQAHIMHLLSNTFSKRSC